MGGWVRLLTVSSLRLWLQPLVLSAWLCLGLRSRGNSQLRSGSVMAPDKTVRTVQQVAVLYTSSAKFVFSTTQAHAQNTQSHQKAQSHFSP